MCMSMAVSVTQKSSLQLVLMTRWCNRRCLLRSHSTRSMTVWEITTGLWMGFSVRVPRNSDRSIGRDGGLIVSRSYIGSWTELRIELTSITCMSLLTRSRRGVNDKLGSSQIQASREWSNGSSVLGTPSTEGFSTHERSVPDNVDILGTDTDDNTLHSERYTTRSRVLRHDDSISKSEFLTVQSMDRMGRFENSLSGDTVDCSSLDHVVSLLRSELISNLLNLSDRFLSVSSDPRVGY
jgi:hypothetical protein